MLTEAQEKRLATWQSRNQPMYRKAMEGRCAHIEAIQVMCLQCVGEDRAAIRDCKDITCPIWSFRPFKESQ